MNLLTDCHPQSMGVWHGRKGLHLNFFVGLAKSGKVPPQAFQKCLSYWLSGFYVHYFQQSLTWTSCFWDLSLQFFPTLQLRDYIRLGNWKPFSWGKKKEFGKDLSISSLVIREDSIKERLVLDFSLYSAQKVGRFIWGVSEFRTTESLDFTFPYENNKHPFLKKCFH